MPKPEVPGGRTDLLHLDQPESGGCGCGGQDGGQGGGCGGGQGRGRGRGRAQGGACCDADEVTAEGTETPASVEADA